MEKGLMEIGQPKEIKCFKLVYWADILNKEPQEVSWNECLSPTFLKTDLPEEGRSVPVRQNALEVLKKTFSKVILNDDMSINFSFITDAIVDKYFKELEVYYKDASMSQINSTLSIRELIRNRLIDILKVHKEDEIMLIGHSMGSLIAYDVLSSLPADHKIKHLITMGSPLGLPVVMSKIASHKKGSHIQDHKMESPAVLSGSWQNFSDPNDRIALYNKLSDSYLPNSNRVSVEDIMVRNFYTHNGEKNPHKSFGYLRCGPFAMTLHSFLNQKEVVLNGSERGISSQVWLGLKKLRKRINGYYQASKPKSNEKR